MYIAPSSTFKFCSGVPLTKTYEHVGYWSSESAQYNAINSYAEHTETNVSFIRGGAGGQTVIRSSIVYSELYDCNYLMFQNPNFGSKWFYAFIDSVEYVSNNTTYVYFTIDEMTTWFFDYSLPACMVEREHVTSDSAANWLQPEPIDGGEMEIRSLVDLGVVTGGKIALIATRDGELLFPYNGDIAGRVYSCYQMETYTSATDLNERLNNLKAADKINEKVIGCYAIPEQMTMNRTTKKVSASRPSTVDGYAPHNLKVLSVLYNRCFVTNSQGSAIELDYHDFSGNPTFEASFTMSAGVPEVSLVPTNYNNTSYAYDKKLLINNFPQCPINTTGYQEWLARQMGRLVSIGGAIAGAIGNVPLAIGAGLAGNLMTNTSGNSYSSGTQSSCVDWSGANLDFYAGQLCIKAANARVLDDFFERYGYAINRVKIPSRNGRSGYNYVKTNNVKIVGEMPASSVEIIENVYNNGTTFWNSLSRMGDYSIDNSIIEEVIE